MTSTAERIQQAVVGTRFHFSDEAALQDGIAALLGTLGIAHDREWELRPYGRVDFYVASDALGIEVKVKGSPSAVVSQIHGYAQHADVSSLLLVTSRIKLARLPESMNGKPLLAVSLWANGL